MNVKVKRSRRNWRDPDDRQDFGSGAGTSSSRGAWLAGLDGCGAEETSGGSTAVAGAADAGRLGAKAISGRGMSRYATGPPCSSCKVQKTAESLARSFKLPRNAGGGGEKEHSPRQPLPVGSGLVQCVSPCPVESHRTCVVLRRTGKRRVAFQRRARQRPERPIHGRRTYCDCRPSLSSAASRVRHTQQLPTQLFGESRGAVASQPESCGRDGRVPSRSARTRLCIEGVPIPPRLDRVRRRLARISCRGVGGMFPVCVMRSGRVAGDRRPNG
jgi:hypothetical protein